MNATNQRTPARAPVKKRATRNPVRSLAREAVEAVLAKKGHDVTVMDMRKVSGVADYFVLCTGDSDLQVRAVADAVQERIREQCGERPWHVEGYDHLQWVLLDYVDLVVHVFNQEKRAFYALERLWGDAPVESVSDDASADSVKLLQEETAEQPAEQPAEQRAEENENRDDANGA